MSFRLLSPSATAPSRGVESRTEIEGRSIASAASDFLVVAVDRFWDTGVQNGAQIRLIDPETEC